MPVRGANQRFTGARKDTVGLARGAVVLSQYSTTTGQRVRLLGLVFWQKMEAMVC
jgi:hypothetical protein